MNKIKLVFLFWVTVLMMTSCFKVYEPEIEGSDFNKLVVSGQVTDFDGNQTITISKSSSINVQEEIPVTGCTVTVFDDKGNQFPMIDSSSGGKYRGRIDAGYFTTGSSFKVEIITPAGDKIISDFDQFNACPEIDSVYYLRKDLPTNDPEQFTEGIQFYIDLNGDNSDGKYYRFEAIETWEYHALYPIEWLYNGSKVVQMFPPDFSKYTCWATLPVKNIFTLSTEKLAENKYQQLPLHFVDNTTSRLLYGYSLLLKQHAISETAHKYWSQLSTISAEEGGLYNSQPQSIKGNLYNVTHPDEVVLGFFGVSSVTSKRIFIHDVEDLEVEYQVPCNPIPLGKWGFASFVHLPKPLYLVGDSQGWQPFIMNAECVDCTATKGVTKKPYFWPN